MWPPVFTTMQAFLSSCALNICLDGKSRRPLSVSVVQNTFEKLIRTIYKSCTAQRLRGQRQFFRYIFESESDFYWELSPRILFRLNNAILIEVTKLWQLQVISCDAEIKNMFSFLRLIEKEKNAVSICS